MTTQFIGRVAVEISGHGDVVLFIHGLGGSSNTFTPLLLGSDSAFARYKAINVDLPGSGRSGRVEGTLSLERFIAAAVSVCSALNVTRAHVVAHSMGTIVAQHLAVHYPSLVRSLVLLGPLFCPPEPARKALLARAVKARSEGTIGMAQIADSLVQASTSAHTKRHTATAAAFVRESVMRQSAKLYALSCEALAEMQAVEPSAIKCPTLLITGDEDVVAPPQSVRFMQEKIAGSAMHVLTACGHWTPIEQPAQCASLMRAFYAQRM